MSYGQNKEEMLLKEPVIWVGSVTAPDTIATILDPLSLFTVVPLGYSMQGSLTINMNRTYAIAKSGTPQFILRQDLVEKTVGLTTSLFQFNQDLLQLALGLRSVTNGLKKFNHIGFDEPIPPQQCYLLKGKRVDGSLMYIAFWSAQVTTEDLSIAFSGTEHATIPFTLTAFPDFTNFTLNEGNDDQDCLGTWWTVEASSAS
jgi:hypothetical protein